MPLYANNQEGTQFALDGIGVNDKEVEMMVPMLSPQYQRPVYSKLIDKMEGATVKRKANQRLINVYRQENDYPRATILTSNTVAGVKQLVFTENDFSAIPLNNMVFAETGAIGKVVAKGNGTMSVSFVANPNGNTAFVTADFAANESCIDGGDIGNLTIRLSKETVFSLPTGTQNIVPTYNNSCYLDFEDFVNMTYLRAADGSKYYATNKDVQCLERLHQQYVRRTYGNVPAVLSGTEPIASSLINQIASMGGTVRPLSTAMTYTELKSAIREYTSKGGFTTNEVFISAGNQYIANFQEAMEVPMIQYNGTNNTIGVLDGINAYKFAFQGLDIILANEPILDNKRMWGTGSDGFSKRSNSAIWGNMAPVKVEGGGTMPFIGAYYVGPGNTTNDIQRWITPGNMDDKGNRVAQGQPYKGCKIEYTWDKVEQLMNPRAWMAHGTF